MIARVFNDGYVIINIKGIRIDLNPYVHTYTHKDRQVERY